MTMTATMPEQETVPVKKVNFIPVKPEFAQKGLYQKSLRVAAYCRVSTDLDEQEKSYEAQKNYYNELIMKNPEWQMAGIYADEGISGTQARKRPEFMRMIRDCKKGKIDLIITKAIQRFARNTLDSLEYTRMLKGLGIGVIFELQNIDTRDMSNEFMLTIFACMAQNESENISGNVKWGRQKAFRNGSVHFAYGNFLGYRKGADGKPEIVPEEAEIIRRIYADYLSGSTLRDIIGNLQNDGITTATGKKEWSTGAVKAILKNEKYVGDALLQKTYVTDCLTHKVKINTGELPQYYVDNNHPAIIDRGVWNRVQEELARRSSKRKVKEVGTTTEQGKYSGKYALTELLVCGECGTPYRRCTWSRNGKKKIVWRCISRLDYGTKYCKESATVEESLIKEIVLETIMEAAQMDTSALNILKQHIGIGLTGDDNGEDDQYAIQARLGTIVAELKKLYVVQAQNLDEDYGHLFAPLYAERDALNRKLTEVKAVVDHASSTKSRLDGVFTVMDGLKNRPLDWDESVIRQMLECVRVLGDGALGMRFRWGIEVKVGMEREDV